MSMPKIEQSENPIDREQSVSNLVESVALMETGLAHIINAEGEKIQKVIKHDEDTEVPIENILQVNNSVNKMVNSISKLEMILQNKLDSTKCLDNITQSGSIIPYSGYIHLATDIDGTPLYGGAVSFAYTATPLNIPLNGVTDTVDIFYNISSFSLPRDGIITAFSAFIYVVDPHSIAPNTQVVAKLYTVEPGSTIFKAIEGASIYFEPLLNPDDEIELTANINGLNIEIPATHKVALMFYINSSSSSTIHANCGGGINIK